MQYPVPAGDRAGTSWGPGRKSATGVGMEYAAADKPVRSLAYSADGSTLAVGLTPLFVFVPVVRVFFRAADAELADSHEVDPGGLPVDAQHQERCDGSGEARAT